jgi:pimeloyl-ACP methyl ester carboxylesterase
MPTIGLDSGTIHYENSGPAGGRPVVFVHGYAMGASLWRPLSERLAQRGLRCIASTWPLGAHPEPMRPGADLTMAGVAAMIAEFLEALELEDVVLVGNDSGGALAQIVAGTYPQRLGGLVLTSCDAFEHFPPPILKPLIAVARNPLVFRLSLMPLGTAAGRRRAYGKLAYADLDALSAAWVRPALADCDVAEDLRRFTASMVRSVTVQAAARLPTFAKPALVAWSADDLFFPVQDGRRLAELLPAGRFALVERARTFSMLDQTEALADLIGELAVGGGAQAGASRSSSVVG